MDPLSLESIGADALHQGIQLLYAEAREFLSRDRGAKDDGSDPELRELEPQIEKLTQALEAFRADSGVAAEPSRDQLLIVDALRRCVEAVQGKAFEFPGEQRVVADIDVGNVSGYVAGVLADASVRGTIEASISSGDVSGTVIGVELTDARKTNRN
jgi:hypothetical protein